jgi:hypothetical protein
VHIVHRTLVVLALQESLCYCGVVCAKKASGDVASYVTRNPLVLWHHVCQGSFWCCVVTHAKEPSVVEWSNMIKKPLGCVK